MKIVQINAVYGFGSTGIIVKDIQSACEAEEIECLVVYVQGRGPVKNTYKIGNYLSNKLHALFARISGKQGYFSYISTWKLLRFLDKYKPDVLHLHNLHSCYINLPMLLKYASRHNIPVVVTLHDCWFYTGGCSHYTSVGCDKWLHKCGKCPLRYSESQSLLWDGSSQILSDRYKLFGNISKLAAVGVSQWITDEAKKTVFKNATCIAIRNGVDVDFFRPTESDFRKRYKLENKFIILAPANKWFLPINKETLEYVTSQLSDDMVIVFFGSGTPSIPLTSKMLNIGFISSREEIRDLYSAGDVLVNCTREESLSLLNVEVQACGTPVITYANTGVKETVDGICGFAVENGNPQVLVKHINTIKENGKQAYSEKCIEWVKHSFDKYKNYSLYVNLYKSLKN